MAQIKIVVGTVYGNALEVADMAKEMLTSAGHQADVLRQAALEDVTADGVDVVLVCTSTTGQGDIPSSLVPLYSQLQDTFPSLSHKRYGLIALGDSSYDSFAGAGHQMDELLQSLQMPRVGEMLVIDACETRAPCDKAQPWLEDWIGQLN